MVVCRLWITCKHVPHKCWSLLSTSIYWKEEHREKEGKKTQEENKKKKWRRTKSQALYVNTDRSTALNPVFLTKKYRLVVHTIFSLKMFYQYFCDSQTFPAMLTALCSASQDGGNVNVSTAWGGRDRHQWINDFVTRVNGWFEACLQREKPTNSR